MKQLLAFSHQPSALGHSREKWRVERIINDDDEAIIRVDFGTEVAEFDDVTQLIEFIAAATTSPCTRWELTPADALRLGAEIERVARGDR